MLSLRIVSEIQAYEDPSLVEQSVSKNAYDFMEIRNRGLIDPHMNKWAASIRAPNFATITAPLCVCQIVFSEFDRHTNLLFDRCRRLELSSIILSVYTLPPISLWRALEAWTLLTSVLYPGEYFLQSPS